MDSGFFEQCELSQQMFDAKFKLVSYTYSAGSLSKKSLTLAGIHTALLSLRML